ncbi:MAG TPA: hypothetical protein VMH80_03750 [Bryobacteraceae bacterium]|nr:hypothetical protein [Bryobacteraceae bacterium]
MNDTDDFTAKYRRHNEILAECNAFNKSAVFDALADSGITTVTVNFNGEGDSGQIEDVSALSDGVTVPVPDTQVDVRSVMWGSDAPETTRTPLYDAIEALCYDFLSETHGGWENNDGAFGDFTFGVKDRSIALDFNARFSDTVNYSHTF